MQEDTTQKQSCNSELLQLALSCKATAGVTRDPGARLQRYARADFREQLGDLLSQSSEGSGHESEESNPLTQ